MIGFFSNIFGYILNIIYDIVKNYGLAIILFSILLKLILLPLTIKQQKSIKKTQKIQEETKKIQDKYKNDPEKMNREIMELYKRENMNPLSGCLSSIIQIILLFGMFYLVRSPLTYMKKMDKNLIEQYKEKITMEQGENSISKAYPEISIIKYINNKIDNKEVENTTETENVIENTEVVNPEESNNEENIINNEEEELKVDESLYINMNFLGLDLNSVPQENYKDIKVYIIPVLYIISSFISIKMTQNQQPKAEKKENKESSEENMSEQMNKSMLWMMPILAVSVSMVAPLGLALYWLVNNILMILERIVIDKIFIPKEENIND